MDPDTAQVGPVKIVSETVVDPGFSRRGANP